MQPIGTYLHGRRLYEAMAYWDGPAEAIHPNTATSHGSAEGPEDRFGTGVTHLRYRIRGGTPQGVTTRLTFRHGLLEEGRAGVFVRLAWDRKD